MAQQVQVTLVDDLDGGPAEETIAFALDGATYEVDLSAKNAAKLRDTLALYVGSGRRVGGRAASGRGRGRGASRAARGTGDTAEIRAWARSKKLKINERGRIPGEIVEQYHRENG